MNVKLVTIDPIMAPGRAGKFWHKNNEKSSCFCTSYIYYVYMTGQWLASFGGAITILSVVALLLLSVTMGLSLAHALEFPGKLRLDEPTYRAVQAIYYPGFTIGGLVGELGGLLVLVILLFATRVNSERFWWTAAALGFLVLVHATYWLVTHPVNLAWLKHTKISGAGASFFGLFSAAEDAWRQMRNIWESSHLARACFATLSFLSMTLALIR